MELKTSHIRDHPLPLRPCGYFALPPGTRVQVQHCASSYSLAAGLEPGDWVTIKEFDAGYYTVEKGGQAFAVFITNVVEVESAQPMAKSSGTANRQSHNGGLSAE